MLKDTRYHTALCFDDVLLAPRYSDIESRSEISCTTDICSRIALDLPIISSPMDTITGSAMAESMTRAGGAGIIHRYNTVEMQAEEARSAVAREGSPVGAAIGVTGDYLERARALYKAGARIICVDIAHGHHVLMRHALKVLRNTFGTTIHIMAGNVATLEGFNDLSDWGADSIRVGIGGGSICSTRIQTGHGIPTLQSIIECSASDRNATLIADGGIRNSGDIVKALAAGADAVILGSLLAGTTQAPGDLVYVNGLPYKEYRGMASVEAQIDWRGHTSSIEGVSSMVPSKGNVSDVLEQLRNGICSGFSYSGARSLSEFHAKANFIKQTSAGTVESSTHINHHL